MLSGGSALAALGGALASRSLVGEAEAFLAGTTDKQQFVESIVPFALLTVIQLVLWVAAAAVVMTWMFRIAANHRVLHRGGTWGPAWGIGGWFLPPMLYVIPLLMIRELWKAADPGTPVGSEWRGNRASPITVVWFVIYSVIPLAIMFSPGSGTFSGLGNQERAMAEGIAENSELTLFAALVSIAGAVVFAVMARQLTARHQQLTGELLG